MADGRAILNIITRFMEPHVRSIRLMITRVVADIVIDTTGIQTVQSSLLFGEFAELERFQNYGFTSVPFSQSAEGIAVFVGGNREHGVIIAMDDRTFRKGPLLPGQAAVYDAVGSYFQCNNDGTSEAFALAGISLGNTITTEPALKGSTFQAVFNSHVHAGNLGFSTGSPLVPSIPSDLSLTVNVGL